MPTSGMLVIDKPAGMTSHDVVAAVRRRLKVRAGHTGTLDPQATGVLLVCLGTATRLARFLQDADKEYEGTIRFGWETDTYDADGEPLAEPVPVRELARDEVERAVGAFVGEIEQVPPAYSAKKLRGEPSYRRVRRGEEVAHAPVRVRVDAIEVLGVQAERLHLRVTCGSGTYVRTLAVDIGRALGCPAHLEALRRLRVGAFGLGEALDWSSAESMSNEEILARVLPPARVLEHWPAVIVDDAGSRAVCQGSVIEPRSVRQRFPGRAGEIVAGGGHGVWVRVLDEGGALLAAAEARPGGVIQPRVVVVTTG